MFTNQNWLVWLTPCAGSSPAFGTMFIVYALKSISCNFIYVGMTENLQSRLIRHNKGYVKSTKIFVPNILLYYKSCKSGVQFGIFVEI